MSAAELIIYAIAVLIMSGGVAFLVTDYMRWSDRRRPEPAPEPSREQYGRPHLRVVGDD